MSGIVYYREEYERKFRVTDGLSASEVVLGLRARTMSYVWDDNDRSRGRVQDITGKTVALVEEDFAVVMRRHAWRCHVAWPDGGFMKWFRDNRGWTGIASCIFLLVSMVVSCIWNILPLAFCSFIPLFLHQTIALRLDTKRIGMGA